eukprot:119122-Prymnesium_polylepis.1
MSLEPLVTPPALATTSARRVADRCKDLGATTAHLSLVSSLSAGYAFSALVNSEWSPDKSISEATRMLALSGSLALAAFVLCYTLLECYYTTILSSSIRHMGEKGGLREDHCARCNEAINRFAWLREWARNSLWASVLLALVAAGARVNEETCSGISLVATLLLGIGGLSVVYTVRLFRATFLPLLQAPVPVDDEPLAVAASPYMAPTNWVVPKRLSKDSLSGRGNFGPGR